MAQVRMPDVPAGPVRAFYERVHELHAAAGRPSMRELQRRTRSRERPRGINPTTIHDLFSSRRLARWQIVAAIVEQLGGDVDEFAELWRRAREASAAVPRLDPVPAQLPLDAHGFTGRSAELVRLDAELAATADQPTATVIVALSGTAGVGRPESGI